MQVKRSETGIGLLRSYHFDTPPLLHIEDVVQHNHKRKTTPVERRSELGSAMVLDDVDGAEVGLKSSAIHMLGQHVGWIGGARNLRKRKGL